MTHQQKPRTISRTIPVRQISIAVAMSSLSTTALAFSTVNFDNGVSLQTQLTANYTISTRLDDPDSEYLADLNNDDGTRNFDQWSLINNRVSVFGEAILRYKNYGAVIRGSHFYDQAYHRSNDNNSPETVNRFDDPSEFVHETKRRSGGEARLLDAYAFGNFSLGGSRYLSVKAGRHLVAWGESLFFANISQGQAPVDATKFNVPGTELKEAYLPVGQVSFNLSLNRYLTFTGFWQYNWEETRINPVGSFFGSDFFGPGSQAFRLQKGELGARPDTTGLAANYAGDTDPDDNGQWGMGVRFSPDFNTEIGLYHYRYHARTPSLFFDFTGATQYSSAHSGNALGMGPGVPNYKLVYFEDIKLTGVSLSTKIMDPVQVGVDVSYRDGAPVVLDNGASTTGEILQTNLNAIYILGPSFLSDQTTFTGELLNQRIQDVDELTVKGGLPGTNGVFKDYTYEGQTKSSSLMALAINLNYLGIAQGWDLTTSANYTQNISGTGAQGYGRDEKRLTLGADFTYLGNFSAGATLVNYLSSANIDRGRLLADRDYLSMNFKYTF